MKENCNYLVGSELVKHGRTMEIVRLEREPAPKWFRKDTDEACAVGKVAGDLARACEIGESISHLGKVTCRRCGDQVFLRLERIK